MIRTNENSSSSCFGKSLLTEYREQMARKEAATHDPEAKEEIQQLVELAQDLDVLLERS